VFSRFSEESILQTLTFEFYHFMTFWKGTKES